MPHGRSHDRVAEPEGYVTAEGFDFTAEGLDDTFGRAGDRRRRLLQLLQLSRW